jgi:hypothetical protein
MKELVLFPLRQFPPSPCPLLPKRGARGIEREAFGLEKALASRGSKVMKGASS